MTFFEWIECNYGTDFDLYGLTDAEYYELEDIYNGQFEVIEAMEDEQRM